MVHSVAVLLVALTVVPVPTARAALPPHAAALTWVAPAGCPTADEVMEDVERTLVTRRTTPPAVSAVAHVAEGPRELWRGDLVLRVGDTRTERRFEAESCAAIATVVALIIAIAVEDAPAAAPVVSSPAAPPPPPSDEGPPVLKIRPPEVVVRPTRFFGTLSGVLDWNTMPSRPAAGLELAGGRKWILGPWRLGAVLGVDFFPTHPAAAPPYVGGVSGDFWMVSLSPRGCGGFAASRLEIGPCLGVELVDMHASAASSSGSNAFITVQNQTEYWLSYVASLAASWNFAPALDVALRFDLVVPTTRKIFGLQDSNLWDYVVSTVAVRPALGLVYRF
jgi:hypothetical protein